MAKIKIELVKTTKISKVLTVAGTTVEMEEKEAKKLIDSGIAIDPKAQKVVEIVKDKALATENEALKKELEELKAKNGNNDPLTGK